MSNEEIMNEIAKLYDELIIQKLHIMKLEEIINNNKQYETIKETEEMWKAMVEN